MRDPPARMHSLKLFTSLAGRSDKITRLNTTIATVIASVSIAHFIEGVLGLVSINPLYAKRLCTQYTTYSKIAI